MTRLCGSFFFAFASSGVSNSFLKRYAGSRLTKRHIHKILKKIDEPTLDMHDSGGITIKSEVYPQKIIEYTRENDIGLFLIVAPYPTNDDHELVYNRVHEIANHYELS